MEEHNQLATLLNSQSWAIKLQGEIIIVPNVVIDHIKVKPDNNRKAEHHLQSKDEDD